MPSSSSSRRPLTAAFIAAAALTAAPAFAQKTPPQPPFIVGAFKNSAVHSVWVQITPVGAKSPAMNQCVAAGARPTFPLPYAASFHVRIGIRQGQSECLGGDLGIVDQTVPPKGGKLDMDVYDTLVFRTF